MQRLIRTLASAAPPMTRRFQHPQPGGCYPGVAQASQLFTWLLFTTTRGHSRLPELSRGRTVSIAIGGAGMTSLSKNARAAGLIYLVDSLVAIVRLVYIPNTLISDNATATVNNIATHELLFRFGILTQLLTGVLWIFVTLALCSVSIP